MEKSEEHKKCFTDVNVENNYIKQKECNILPIRARNFCIRIFYNFTIIKHTKINKYSN